MSYPLATTFTRTDRHLKTHGVKIPMQVNRAAFTHGKISNKSAVHVILAVLAVFLLLGNVSVNAAEEDAPEAVAIVSPDGQIEISVRFDAGTVTYSVASADRELVRQSKLGLQVDDAPLADWQELGHSVSVQDETWKPVWGKRAEVRNHYREVVIQTKVTHPKVGRVDLVFRAYDDGVAFRYMFPETADARFKVTADLSEFFFAGDYTFWSYNGEHHNRGPETIAAAKGPIRCPMTMQAADDLFLCVLEAAIDDFSWMTLATEPGSRVCRTSIQSSEVTAPFATPWRVIMVGEKPGDLVDSDLVENLNPPCAIDDPSWIKPGIAFWDWRAWGHQTDGFTYGLDTESWHRFIDLASESGVRYLLLDANWYGEEFSKESNPLTSKPGTDIPALIKYAKSKNVGIILYLNDVAGWEYGLDRIIRSFGEWGAAGLKYGFMKNVDGQAKVQRTQTVVRLCAENKLLVDFHDGPIPPSGETRTWPNLITREYCHAQADGMRSFVPKTFVTTVFVNMVAGPLDMDNGMFDLKNSKTQRPRVFQEIPSTIVAETARTLITFSGLTVIPDSADSYRKHRQLFDFIAAEKMPWDESRTLDGKIGQFITMMRRSGDTVLIASATNEEARTLKIPLTFLDEGTYQATLYEDAPDAHYLNNREAYTVRQQTVTNQSVIEAKMAPGGGHCIRLVPTSK